MSDAPFDFNETDSEMEDIDLYDHEIREIEAVFNKISEATGTRRSPASLEQEIIERMGEIGFKVRVLFYEGQHQAGGDKFVMPQISIIGRVEKQEEFDHAQQAHEVQTDLLGRRGGEDVRASRPVAVSNGGKAFKRSGSGLYVPGGG